VQPGLRGQENVVPDRMSSRSVNLQLLWFVIVGVGSCWVALFDDHLVAVTRYYRRHSCHFHLDYHWIVKLQEAIANEWARGEVGECFQKAQVCGDL
jgi:hypothetical protein